MQTLTYRGTARFFDRRVEGELPFEEGEWNFLDPFDGTAHTLHLQNLHEEKWGEGLTVTSLPYTVTPPLSSYRHLKFESAEPCRMPEEERQILAKMLLMPASSPGKDAWRIEKVQPGKHYMVKMSQQIKNIKGEWRR